MIIPIQKIVKQLRQFRSLHKVLGMSLAFFVFVSSTTGVLLGWKKNVPLLQPTTPMGTSAQLTEWIPLAEVAKFAILAVNSTTGRENTIDRMDVRPDKGVIKVLFKEGYWEAQVDGKTGNVLSVARRHSDWIEHVHDGSIISEIVKLIYTNIIGVGLITLAGSGLWLWYGPKIIRKNKKDHTHNHG